MTPKQYRIAIERLGLSQAQAGKFLGVDPRQSRRYALGETPVPHAIGILLQLMIKRKLTVDDVLKDTKE